MKHPGKTREQVIEELERAEEALKWLSATAIELVGFPPERDIYEFICTKTKELVGNAIVSVSSVDEETRVLRIRKLAGIGPIKLEKIESLLGKKAVGTSFEGVHDGARHALLSGSLHEVEGGLHRLFFERVPKPVCSAMERLLDIKRIYSIGLKRNGSLFGNVTIVMREGARLNKNVLEAFLNEVSAVLECRLAQEELRKSEEKFRGIAERSFDAIFTSDHEGTFTYLSPTIERIFGYTSSEMVGRHFSEFLAEYEVPRVLRLFGEAMHGRYTEVMPIEVVKKDDTAAYLEVSHSLILDNGRPVGIQGLIRDVTERRRAESALRKEQGLLKQLLELQERERQLISYEIHDGLTQHVFGAQMMLLGMEPHMESLPDKAREGFGRVLQLLDFAGKEARTLINQLRPPILDESGLLAAVDFLISEQSTSAAVKIEFQHDGTFEDLAPPLQAIAFRIIQEGLTNARQHSCSKKVRVALARHDGVLRVEVRDWGCGFNPSEVRENRFGLEGIRERARLFGGNATIDTILGRGTCVSVELPAVNKPLMVTVGQSEE
jgi:PAS domain S-box-containing protein